MAKTSNIWVLWQKTKDVDQNRRDLMKMMVDWLERTRVDVDKGKDDG